MSNKKQSGFTLIELMIVVVIVGVLASIAVPAYVKYTRKAKFSEVINATTAAKAAVAQCAQDTATLIGCSAGVYGIPADIAGGLGLYTASVVTRDGQITAAAIQGSGLNGETYILKAVYDPVSGVSWTTGGTCGGVTC